MRPPVLEEAANLNVTLETVMLKEITALAERRGISRSALIRGLLEKELRLLRRKIGVAA